MKHKAVSYSSKCNPDHEDDDLDICHFFILSAGMLAVVSINDGNWKRVNPAFVRTLGWNESELLDTSYLAIVHPDDLKKTIKVIEDLKSGSNLVTCENRIRCKNGDYKWISWRASSEKNGLVYCAGTDITDYKKTQDELLHQNEILQHIFDNIPVMLAVNDGRFTKLKLNKFAEEILGWTSEEINKRDYMSTIYPDPDYRKNIYEFMQSGSKGWHEWELTTKSGNKFRRHGRT
jgi:PAS domain S-box-containing protein